MRRRVWNGQPLFQCVQQLCHVETPRIRCLPSRWRTRPTRSSVRADGRTGRFGDTRPRSCLGAYATEPLHRPSVNTSKAAIDRHFKTGHHTCGERDGLRSTAGSPGASSAHVDHGFPGRGYPTRIVVCVHVGDDGLWSLWAARAPSKAVWKTRSPPPQLVPGVRPRFPYRWRDPEALGSHSTDEDAARAPPAPAPAL